MEESKSSHSDHSQEVQNPGIGTEESKKDLKDSNPAPAKTDDSKPSVNAELKEEKKQPEPQKPTTPPRTESKHSLEEEQKQKSQPSNLQVNTRKDRGDDRADPDHEDSYKSWEEYRIVGKAPRRRGYHASFVHENYYYIHGGHDIREGTLDKLYRINLDPKGNENEWELLQQRGIEKPGKIGYHTLTRYENKAYLIGGSDLGVDNEKCYEFDIPNCEWRVLRPTGTIPDSRDEHSAVLWKDTIVVFGGNVKGSKSNELWLYNIKENKWEEVKIADSPPERSNHACAILDDTMYIFGGKDIDNNKLDDLWSLDLNSKSWKKRDQKGDCPIARSGCSFVGYKGYLILFGGIYELTKELGDCYAFDVKTNTWYTLFEEVDSPVHRNSPNASFNMGGKFGRSDSIKSPSPMHKGASSSFQADNPNNFSMNLKKTKTKNRNKQPNIFEVDSTMLRKQKVQKALKKKREMEKNPLEDSMLTSPTSLSMKNSFLIKNSNKGFDNYFSTQKRRKLGSSFSPDITNLSPSKVPRNSKVQGVRPRPRDGHSADLFGKYMIIFGGDRHHMPFNDLFSLNLDSELNK